MERILREKVEKEILEAMAQELSQLAAVEDDNYSCQSLDASQNEPLLIMSPPSTDSSCRSIRRMSQRMFRVQTSSSCRSFTGSDENHSVQSLDTSPSEPRLVSPDSAGSRWRPVRRMNQRGLRVQSLSSHRPTISADYSSSARAQLLQQFRAQSTKSVKRRNLSSPRPRRNSLGSTSPCGRELHEQNGIDSVPLEAVVIHQSVPSSRPHLYQSNSNRSILQQLESMSVSNHEQQRSRPTSSILSSDDCDESTITDLYNHRPDGTSSYQSNGNSGARDSYDHTVAGGGDREPLGLELAGRGEHAPPRLDALCQRADDEVMIHETAIAEPLYSANTGCQTIFWIVPLSFLAGVGVTVLFVMFAM
jgi:hypothetical protein